MPSGERRSRRRAEDGFMMAAMLVAIAVMMIAMTAALPVMSTAARREKETELIFRGRQYSRAIGAYQRKYGGASPPSIDELVNQRFLRKKFKDPITDEDFVLVTPESELPTTANIPGLPPGVATAGRGTSSTSTGSRTGGASTTSTTTGRGTSSISTTSSVASGLRSSTPSGTQAGATLGILGVRSKSKDKAFRVYNGLEHYDEWIFMATQAASTVGSPSGGQAGAGGRGGVAGGRGGQRIGGQPIGGQPAGGRGPQPFGGGGRGGAPPSPPPAPPSPFGPR
jgi:type II secretory pathway pseudopilin PulG